MQRIGELWRRGMGGKVIITGGVLGIVVVGCCALVLVASVFVSPQRSVTSTTPQPAQIVAAPTPALIATAEPEPAPTTAPTVEPTQAAVSPADRYIQLAQAGATIPIARINLPKGEWKADITDAGRGPEVTLTMPVSVGLSNEQTVRQAKRHLAQAVKALFDGDAEIVRVTAIGTVPDGPNQEELPAVSIFILRTDYAGWDGTAENLGEWRVAPRYQ